MTRRWLHEASPDSFARYLRFWREVVYPFWREHATAALRDGEPPVTLYEWLDDHPDRWAIAQAGFEMTAEMLADDVAATVDVPPDAVLLDVGGGHGRYAVAFCERYPSLSATVLDDERVLDIARDTVAAAGLADRVSLRAGDYETDDLGDGYDLALLFNVVHGNDPATNRELLRRVRDALAPGGRVAILDQFGDRSRLPTVNAGRRFLDLTYLVTLGGRAYPRDAVEAWLADAGLSVADATEFRDRNSTLLVAERA